MQVILASTWYCNRRFSSAHSQNDFQQPILWNGVNLWIMPQKYAKTWNTLARECLRGIWNITLIRPIIYEDSLIGQKNWDILQGPLSDFLKESVSLSDLSKIRFQHDGAPAHSPWPYTFLKSTFGNKIIGRPVEWSPSPWSPDLSPLDFFL